MTPTAKTVDLLVLGAGMAGCAAAVRAAQEGASVVVAEKAQTVARLPSRSARSKHDAILEAAVRAFGRDGYEDSRWADVAKSVGIGSTALYHYFESKLHCLYVIMADTLQARLEQFEADTRDATDYPAAMQTVLRAGLDLTEQQVLCMRVLVSEQARLAVHRTSPREEEARQRARAHPRHGIRVGNLPGASDGAGRHPGSRPEAAHARCSRLAQQRLALVPGRWRPEPR